MTLLDIPLPFNIKKKIAQDSHYLSIIDEFITHPEILKMSLYPHHGHIDCLSHCIHVSYIAYKLGKVFRLNSLALAKASILHDFYLYDWHIKGDRKGLHGFTHPKLALENALRYFNLSPMESNIITTHMWPMTAALPKYRESFVVILTDKYCALIEFFFC